MSPFESLALIGVGLVVLLVGAEGLVRGAVALALRFGLTPLVVGLTVVAFGTSSPELVVSVDAALKGNGGFAVGNVVGSNVANLALIVGLSALLRPLAIETKLVSWDLPVLLGSAVALVLFLLDGALARWEGAVLALGIVAYVVISVRASRQAARTVELPEEVREEMAQTERPLWRSLLFVGAGLGLLVLGAEWLLAGAVGLATRMGVSEAVIGLTLVAFGTSLPELATTVVAAVRKQGEVALGNAIGSNIFNTLGVLGPAALVAPMSRDGVGDGALLVMLGVSLLTLLLLWSGYRARRWEGALLLVVYVVYLWWVIAG
ncbi:MAG: calcium/sodium antiporter [Rubricoccaceae bacterium]|nr:calcium/sodium antiporter [Rubricoccaceae bacterium]